MFHSLTSQIGAIAMALVCGYAIWRGGWPERLAAITLALNWVGCEALEDFNVAHKAQPVVFGIDVAYAVLLLVLLTVTERIWVIFAFAMQGLIVLTHIAAALDPVVSRWDFFNTYFVWSYAVLVAMLLGTHLEARVRPVAPFLPPRHPTSTPV